MVAGPTNQRTSITLHALLAAVMVFGTLAPIVVPATAQAATDMSVTVGPFFEGNTASPTYPTCIGAVTQPALRAQPDGSIVQVRHVRVFNGGPTQKAVTFRYTLVSDPGTQTNPGLTKALQWDDAQSSAPGWSAPVADNSATSTGGVRTLTFTGGSLSSSAEFTIAFRVPTAAAGDSGTTPTPDQFPINVQGTTLSNNLDTTANPTSFCIRTDTTAPTITSAITRDADRDGRIDQIVLTFSEAIDPDTINKNQFLIKGTDPTPYTVLSNSQTKAGLTDNGNGLGTALADRQVILFLSPGYSFDTGVRPTITYPIDAGANTIADLAGNRMNAITGSTLIAADGAKPVLVSVFAYDGASQVVFTFSEPVRGSNADGTMRWDDPTATTPTYDFTYSDSGPSGGAGNCINALANLKSPSQSTPPTNTLTVQVYTSTGNPGCTPVKVGSADSHPTNGDRWALALMSNPPSTCPAPDFVPCDAVIVDTAGLRGVTKQLASIIMTSPFVREAEVNIDSFQLTLRFNGPVSSADGDGVGIKLQDVSVISADGSGQGPAGIVAIQHRAGSDKAILTLDHRTRPTDVDDTPARIHIACNRVKGTGIPTFVPCFDPDNDHDPDVNMVDHTPPAILSAATYDGNHNGYLDGIKLTFNEPVDDATFCIQDAITGASPQPKKIVSPCDTTTGPLHISNNYNGPYTFDTDLLPNDDEGIIRFPEVHAIGSVQLGPDTYVIPEITTDRAGLFSDLSRPAPVSPEWQQSNLMLQICKTLVGCTLTCADPSLPCATTVTETDGAPPVVMAARTVDTRPLVAPATIGCITSQPKCSDLEGDGFIDGYNLTMSEPVNDKTFRASEWRVAGHVVLGMRSAVPLTDVYDARNNTGVRDCLGTNNATTRPNPVCNDANLVLLFSKGTTPDTDQTPELTYVGPSSATLGLKDGKGNAMVPFNPVQVIEADDSPPVIVGINATVGRDVVSLRFSEPVDDGNRGPLSHRAFQYGNVNYLSPQSAVSGLRDQNAVEHKAGSPVVNVTLNAKLTESDVSNDTIGAILNSVWETSSTVLVKKAASVKPHSMLFSRDLVAPGEVTPAVEAALTSANSVSLVWTAPGSDGYSTLPALASNGKTYANVTGYMVEVSTQPIKPEAFGLAGPGVVAFGSSDKHTVAFTDGSKHLVDLGNGISAEFTPDLGALAKPGQAQRVQISGLSAETTYHFAVAAFDDATPRRHNATIPNVDVSTATGRDFTPPAPTPVIASLTHSPDVTRPKQLSTAIFTWTSSVDRESKVTYHYVLSQESGYTVTAKDPMPPTTSNNLTVAVSAPGIWTFHLAACSGGGCTATAHYTFAVGRAKIDPVEILVANSYTNFTARRDDKAGVTTVSWTLPDKATFPANAELQAVDIYRLDGCLSDAGCTTTKVTRIPGDYASLQVGSYVDNATGASLDSAYRVDMVFADGQTQDPSVSGFAKVVDVTPGSTNWLLIGIIAGAVVLLAALGIVLYARRAKAPTPVEPWQEQGAAGLDPTSGMPTHDVRCPSCQTAFQAVGMLPLQISCPNCGVGGLLQ